jgi:hypothetical protein
VGFSASASRIAVVCADGRRDRTIEKLYIGRLARSSPESTVVVTVAGAGENIPTSIKGGGCAAAGELAARSPPAPKPQVRGHVAR